jgi:predicted RNA-binding protein with EMAP domain
VFIELYVASSLIGEVYLAGVLCNKTVSCLDTAKDARILVMEDALRRLNDIIGNRKLKIHVEYSKLTEILKHVGSLVYEVKYSYVPADQVADLEPTKKIVEYVSEFRAIIEQALKSSGYKPATSKETLTQAELTYCFRIVQGFQYRLKHFDDDPAYAVDMLAVEISQTQPIPDSKHLTECRCTDGSRIWRIVTNIQGLKANAILPCAILPPVDMMDVISEGMFLDGVTLPESTKLGSLENPSPSILDQARAQVLHITKRMI